MFFEALGAILQAGWQTITTVKIPSTNISFAAMFIGTFLAAFSLKIVAYMMNVGISTSGVRGAIQKDNAHRMSERRYMERRNK